MIQTEARTTEPLTYPREHRLGGSVYFVARTLDGFGGGGRAGADIVLAMLAAGADLTVVSANRFPVPASVAGQEVLPPRWVAAPRPQVRRSLRSRGVRGIAGGMTSGLIDAYRNVWRVKILEEAVRTVTPALIVHNGFPHPNSRHLELIDRDMRSPHVMIVHSSAQQVASFAVNLPGLSVDSLARQMSDCDGLVFVSPQIRDEWLSLLPHRPRLVRTIPPCCRDEQIARLRDHPRARVRRRLGHANDDFVIVTVGKVHPMKGQDQIVASMRTILSHMPNARLVVVGPRSRESAALDGEVRRLDLTHRITFTGPSHEALEHIYAADVLLHASRAEGLGLVIAEAMALGTPVIASDAGGIPSLVIDGETGLAFPVDDPDAMVGKLRELVADPAATRARVALAENHYHAHFSRPVMVAAYRELLEDLSANGRT